MKLAVSLCCPSIASSVSPSEAVSSISSKSDSLHTVGGREERREGASERGREGEREEKRREGKTEKEAHAPEESVSQAAQEHEVRREALLPIDCKQCLPLRSRLVYQLQVRLVAHSEVGLAQAVAREGVPLGCGEVPPKPCDESVRICVGGSVCVCLSVRVRRSWR